MRRRGYTVGLTRIRCTVWRYGFHCFAIVPQIASVMGTPNGGVSDVYPAMEVRCFPDSASE